MGPRTHVRADNPLISGRTVGTFGGRGRPRAVSRRAGGQDGLRQYRIHRFVRAGSPPNLDFAVGSEGARELPHRLETIVWGWLQALVDDGSEPGGKVRSQLVHRHWWHVQDVEDDDLQLAGRMRELSSQTLVQHRAERVDVRAVVNGAITANLLRRHVAERAEHLPGLRRQWRAAFAAQLGNAKIQDLGQIRSIVPVRHEQVVRLQVAMDDALGMGNAEGMAGLNRQAHCALNRQHSSLVEDRAQALAPQQLHHHVGGARVGESVVGDGDHVFAIERTSGLGFALKPGDRLRVLGEIPLQELHGEVAPDELVPRLIHHAHAALAQLAQQLVLAREDFPCPRRSGSGGCVLRHRHDSWRRAFGVPPCVRCVWANAQSGAHWRPAAAARAAGAGTVAMSFFTGFTLTGPSADSSS